MTKYNVDIEVPVVGTEYYSLSVEAPNEEAARVKALRSIREDAHEPSHSEVILNGSYKITSVEED
jgi:hypothetical protein